jgi:hypothetical protein
MIEPGVVFSGVYFRRSPQADRLKARYAAEV